MSDWEASLTDVFEQLQSLYDLIAGAEDRAIDRHKELVERLDSIDSNTGYSDTSGIETAVKEGNKILQRIASNTR